VHTPQISGALMRPKRRIYLLRIPPLGLKHTELSVAMKVAAVGIALIVDRV